jgi:hypothetical protein
MEEFAEPNVITYLSSMRLSYLVLLFTSCPFFCGSAFAFHNKIDDITAASEVKELLLTTSDLLKDAKEDEFSVPQKVTLDDPLNQRWSDSLGILPWYKADLDQNGYTDMLVNAKWGDQQVVFLVTDSGADHFTATLLHCNSFDDHIFPKVIPGAAFPLVVAYRIMHLNENDRYLHRLVPDTLICKFGSLIEYHSTLSKKTVKRFTLDEGGCYGTCPVFEMTITANGSATYDAKFYNKTTGKFTGTISKTELSELMSLLNYLDLPSLNDSYAVNWTDDQEMRITVTYSDGSTKKINDYGGEGTYGLKRFYKLVEDLRETQQWK